MLVIGIDGASPVVVRPMLAEGRLPHLGAMARAGAGGPLLSVKRLLSPAVWTSVATGKEPQKHGITGFVQRVEGRPSALFRSSDRKVHALWNIASRAGLEVAVVNWWTTYPPEVIDGVMVSDHAIPGSLERQQRMRGVPVTEAGTSTWPESWSERVVALADADDDVTRMANAASDEIADLLKPLIAAGHSAGATGGDPDTAAISRQWVAAEANGDALAARIALEAEAELRPDLLMVFMPGIDRMSHMLWAGVEPPSSYPEGKRLSPAARQAAGAALRRYYEYADAVIGRLLERFGPDDLAIVLSDHGFEAEPGGMLPGTHKSEKARNGILFIRGPGIPAGASTRGSRVIDMTPTILVWFGLPVAEDMDGRPLPLLEVAPVATVATHDTGPIHRLDERDSGSEAEIVEKLRALGYLDDSGEEVH